MTPPERAAADWDLVVKRNPVERLKLEKAPLGIRDELFDASPVVEAAAAFFYGNPEFSNLPRKHKYSIST